MDPLVIRGVGAFILSIVLLAGSVWLLLSLILGAKLGYYISAVTFFGLMVIMSILWFATALGPKGPSTTWEPAGIARDLSEAQHGSDIYDVSAYPAGEFVAPAKDVTLADLDSPGSVAAELGSIEAALQSRVQAALKEPKEGQEADPAHEFVNFETGAFTIVDVRVAADQVEGKQSLIAVGKAVPTASLITGELGQAEEGTVKSYVVKPGDEVQEGQTILIADTEFGDVPVTASEAGTVIELGLRVNDRVKTGVPVATVDITGQGDAPQPVEVAAVRVRGAVRTPALYYLIVSTVLFVLHMMALSRLEKAGKTAPVAA